MGGGSALLINSHGKRGRDFGCQGWFCDVLNMAMSILVLMIIGTAFYGCYRSCCKQRKFQTPRRAPAPKSPRRRVSEGAPEAAAPVSEVIIVISPDDDEEMKNPPEYCENDNLPPAYSSLRFDQQLP